MWALSQDILESRQICKTTESINCIWPSFSIYRCSNPYIKGLMTVGCPFPQVPHRQIQPPAPQMEILLRTLSSTLISVLQTGMFLLNNCSISIIWTLWLRYWWSTLLAHWMLRSLDTNIWLKPGKLFISAVYNLIF